MPWARGPDAVHLPGQIAAHELVPRLPPQPEAAPSAARCGLPYDLPPILPLAERSLAAGPAARLRPAAACGPDQALYATAGAAVAGPADVLCLSDDTRRRGDPPVAQEACGPAGLPSWLSTNRPV